MFDTGMSFCKIPPLPTGDPEVKVIDLEYADRIWTFLHEVEFL